jgi:hypothetical protein
MSQRSRFTVLGLLIVIAGVTACDRAPMQARQPSSDLAGREVPDGESRWRYRASVDGELTRMQLGLCIEGSVPHALVAGDDALEFVRSARVRGGDELEREGERLILDTLGSSGCIDLELDLTAMADQGERDATRIGESLMLTPTLWLWHPERIPESLDATLELDLPIGIHMTGPWPIEGDQRRLDESAFRWAAWTALGRFEPIEFDAAGCSFELALLGARPQASDDGIRNWIRVAAESSAQLFGRFSRERTSVVVIVSGGWGGGPVHFGMARRGGGASAMLILDPDTEDDELPGEWVSTHEFLHFGMPLVADPWMAEGFVTYYTTILRARRGVLGSDSERSSADADFQTRQALEMLAEGFAGGRTSAGTLAHASETMREQHAYRRVYWGGAAVAMDLDLQLRLASGGRRSLDDLMRSMTMLIPERRRWTADELFERFDREVAGWREAGELDREVSPSAIARQHLDARATPDRIVELHELAVELDAGTIRLLEHPADHVALRRSLFAPHARLD